MTAGTFLLRHRIDRAQVLAIGFDAQLVLQRDLRLRRARDNRATTSFSSCSDSACALRLPLAAEDRRPPQLARRRRGDRCRSGSRTPRTPPSHRPARPVFSWISPAMNAASAAAREPGKSTMICRRSVSACSFRLFASFAFATSSSCAACVSRDDDGRPAPARRGRRGAGLASRRSCPSQLAPAWRSPAAVVAGRRPALPDWCRGGAGTGGAGAAAGGALPAPAAVPRRSARQPARRRRRRCAMTRSD